jgi:hypothetical protein
MKQDVGNGTGSVLGQLATGQDPREFCNLVSTGVSAGVGLITEPLGYGGAKLVGGTVSEEAKNVLGKIFGEIVASGPSGFMDGVFSNGETTLRVGCARELRIQAGPATSVGRIRSALQRPRT